MRRVQLAGPEKEKYGSFGALGLIAGAMIAGIVVAADPAPNFAIGPFRVGMTLDEVRAAGPQLTWKDLKSLDSTLQNGISAPDAVQLGGLHYTVNVFPGWYGAYRLVAYRRAEVSGPGDCANLTEAFIADTEQQYGAFSAPDLKYDEELTIVSGGKPSITEKRKAGNSSNYTWHKATTYSEASAEVRLPAATVTIRGQYFVSSLMFGDSTCQTTLKIETKSSPPGNEELAAAKFTPVLVPSIGVLHDTALGLDIPAAGLTVVARCRIHRDRGTVGGCQSADKLPPGFSSAVVLRSAHLAFDTAALDPGNPVPLFSQLAFRFEPKQRLEIDLPANLLEASAVAWSNEFDVLPPMKSILTSMKAEYDYATVSAACQIQSDGSLVCVDFKVTRPEGQAADQKLEARFLYTAKDQWLSRRAAKMLNSGGASAGRWVTVQQQISLRRINRA